MLVCRFVHLYIPTSRAREQEVDKAMLALPRRLGTLRLRAGSGTSGSGEEVVREGAGPRYTYQT